MSASCARGELIEVYFPPLRAERFSRSHRCPDDNRRIALGSYVIDFELAKEIALSRKRIAPFCVLDQAQTDVIGR